MKVEVNVEPAMWYRLTAAAEQRGVKIGDLVVKAADTLYSRFRTKDGYEILPADLELTKFLKRVQLEDMTAIERRIYRRYQDNPNRTRRMGLTPKEKING